MNESGGSFHWLAGAAALDITPEGSPYLCGYPNVDRLATGVSDPLFASALCVESSMGGVCIFVACDLLQLPCDLVRRVRESIVWRISRQGGPLLGVESVMVTATHTHSGPLVMRMLTHNDDPHVPDVDGGYQTFVEKQAIEAGVRAYMQRRRASLSWAAADGSGLGANRHDPAGVSIPRLPVVVARDAEANELIAVMAVCSMHPTVLHEDSTLISGDFPGLARQWLSEHVLPAGCPFVYHMGAGGNQSPRHVVRANTMAEARRLGEVLGREVQSAIECAVALEPGEVRCCRRGVELPKRGFLAVDEAQERVRAAEAHLLSCKKDGASRAELRTAEVNWFGAGKALSLAKAAAQGLVDDAVRQRMPAEVHVVGFGGVVLVGWPGEVFAEFAIELMRLVPGVTVITLANGDVHGYLVTRDAIDRGSYEAAHGIFSSPESGDELVRQTYRLIQGFRRA